ncbi:hypothetical protein LSTR_LSTR001314 [Laodelphax striatellus]|uniref:Uncharacterized protein n=1 Tax=Laodelphax striatellus TaxID=195883 RepID=A0A482XFA6_LAOST|nr:hypothetical protein LSTR_LSTR001314 [Laodelphax striatellus]
MEFCYLDITLDLAVEKSISAVSFKGHVIKCVKNVFGEFGASHKIDVLKYDLINRSAIIRCPSTFYVKLLSALTLSGEFEGLACCYRLNRSSPYLLSLLSNSRTYEHC